LIGAGDVLNTHGEVTCEGLSCNTVLNADESEGGLRMVEGDVGVAECAVVEVETGSITLSEGSQFVGVELSVGVFVLPDAALAVDGGVGVPVCEAGDTLGGGGEVEVGE
jgi:hypothetical protein